MYTISDTFRDSWKFGSTVDVVSVAVQVQEGCYARLCSFGVVDVSLRFVSGGAQLVFTSGDHSME